MSAKIIDFVRAFHEKHGAPVLDRLATPAEVEARAGLRLGLIQEEVGELEEALGFEDQYGDVERVKPPNLVAVADALGDILYVVYGAALEWGVSLDAVVAEIHRSNMTKEPGNVRGDGKILKGPGYSPPNLAAVLWPASRHSPECDVSFGESCSREPGCTIPPGIDAQPRPSTGDAEVWPLVLVDIDARQAFGTAKYGVPLRTNDGRKSLVDAYQEALDLVVYLRKEIEERKA